MPGSWIGANGGGVLGNHIRLGIENDHVVSSFDPSRVYGLLAEPNIWIGAVAGLALLAGAVYFRQRRIETAT
jgi:ABC-2 type transport system permease protein